MSSPDSRDGGIPGNPDETRGTGHAHRKYKTLYISGIVFGSNSYTYEETRLTETGIDIDPTREPQKPSPRRRPWPRRSHLKRE